jgi:hypothetical protein
MFKSPSEQPASELEQRLTLALERTAELEHESAAAIAQLRSVAAASEAAVHGVGERLAAAAERVAALEHELASCRGAAQELHEAQARVAELEAELAARDSAPPSEPAPPPGRWEGAERHLLFVPGPAGYELVEGDGPPPAVGEVVEGRTVALVAAAALPGGPPCAYLTD